MCWCCVGVVLSCVVLRIQLIAATDETKDDNAGRKKISDFRNAQSAFDFVLLVWEKDPLHYGALY